MRGFAFLISVLAVAFLSFNASAVTNAVPVVVSVCSTSNTPAVIRPRRQCEAVTKSGNRCRRNAVPGAKLCRQHQKISSRQSEVRVRDVPVPHK